jgi:putative ABC transport system permease protein
VQQRRREIGLRLAVGAHPSDVQRQFLTEASVLSLAGALLGIIIGFALVLAFFLAFRGASLGHHFRQAVQAHPVPSPLGISLALAVCLFLGITAGYLPARRAARLNPIDALR